MHVVRSSVLTLAALAGFAAALPATLATPAAAQDRCTAYANEMVGLDQRARQMRCPGWNSHSNWQGHFNWCQTKPPQATRGALDAWSDRFDGCAAAHGGMGGGMGGGARPMPPRPAFAPPPRPAFVAPCNGLAGNYGSAAIAMMPDGRSIQVSVGPRRPLAFGTCNGATLRVNFTDDRVISGRFDGRTIRWDNGTAWTKR